jgi:mRNA-degrading endonuclease RelE of RelBE toxin-antitoxin system
MAYQVLQKRRFLRQYKKLHANVVSDVDDAIADIAEQPSIGERKKGDLAKLFVYKFISQNQQYLLGYTVEDEICLIYLEAISSHENFYRDLKRK